MKRERQDHQLRELTGEKQLISAGLVSHLVQHIATKVVRSTIGSRHVVGEGDGQPQAAGTGGRRLYLRAVAEAMTSFSLKPLWGFGGPRNEVGAESLQSARFDWCGS